MAIWIGGDDTSWDARPEVLSEPEEDWDTLVKYPVVTALSLQAALAQFPKGEAHSLGLPNMFVSDRSGSALVCGIGKYALEVTYKGLAGTKPDKYQITGYSNRATYQGVLSPSSPSVPATTDVSEPILGFTHRWISLERPATDVQGTAQTPPIDLEEPDHVWASAPDVVLAYPDGWVLEKRDAVNIPGTTIWYVTDFYMYYQPWRPNG